MSQKKIDKIIREYDERLDEKIKDLLSKGIYVSRESMAYGYTLALNSLGLKKIPELPSHITSIDLSDTNVISLTKYNQALQQLD